MVNFDCPALQDWSTDAVDTFINYRITIVMAVFLVINLVSAYLKDVKLPKIPAYEKFGNKDKEMLTIRTMQCMFGLLISFTGYTAGLIDLVTGCRFLLKPWAFWAGGGILTVFDFHEFGARWPLPNHVLVHHIAVFTIALFYIEFGVLDEVQFPTVIFISNIGSCWVTDYAHVVFRTSQRLTHIIRARKIYLVVSPPIRILNIFLMSASVVLAVLSQEWLLFGVNLFMAVAYMWNTYKALTFVYKFDCVKYYDGHQKIWLGRNNSLFPSEVHVAGEKKSEGNTSSQKSSLKALLKASIQKVWLNADDFFEEDTLHDETEFNHKNNRDKFDDDDSLVA